MSLKTQKINTSKETNLQKFTHGLMYYSLKKMQLLNRLGINLEFPLPISKLKYSLVSIISISIFQSCHQVMFNIVMEGDTNDWCYQ